MIKSVVRTYTWTPDVIDNLFLDDFDHHGLIFWHNDAKEIERKMKEEK